MTKKMLAPRNATTLGKVIKLQTDNHDTKDSWILVTENNVSLANQVAGEEATGDVQFTHRTFNALVDWYNKEQELTK